MGKRQLDELGSLQRQVMDILWDRGESTVQTVRDALTDPDRTPAYTTILSVLQKLEKLGWVGHRRQGRTYVYHAVRSRGQAGVGSLRRIIDQVFRGDPMEMFQHLLEEDALSETELKSLEAMIAANRRERDADVAE